MKRKLLISIIVLGLLAAYIAIDHIAPRMILTPKRVKVAANRLGAYGLQYDVLNIQVEDDIELKGYYVYSALDTSYGTMLVLDGIGGCKENLMGKAQLLAEKGINSFIYDARAHGESGGEYCTYGFYEKQDVSIIIDSLLNRYGDTRLGIWGMSLGAAVSLQALEYDERIELGIVVSTFADLEQIVFDYQKRMMGIGVRLVTDRSLYRAGQIADFKPETIKPAESAKNIEQPVLYVHGDVDEHIFVKYGEEIFANLASPEKELYIVKRANHLNVWSTGGEGFTNKIDSFLQKHWIN